MDRGLQLRFQIVFIFVADNRGVWHTLRQFGDRLILIDQQYSFESETVRHADLDAHTVTSLRHISNDQIAVFDIGMITMKYFIRRATDLKHKRLYSVTFYNGLDRGQ